MDGLEILGRLLCKSGTGQNEPKIGDYCVKVGKKDYLGI